MAFMELKEGQYLPDFSLFSDPTSEFRYERTAYSNDGCHVWSRVDSRWYLKTEVTWPHVEAFARHRNKWVKMEVSPMLDCARPLTKLQARAENAILQGAFDEVMREQRAAADDILGSITEKMKVKS